MELPLIIAPLILTGELTKVWTSFSKMRTPDCLAPPNPISEDPAWKYHHLIDANKKNMLVCNFCNLISSGGIYRAKYHLIGGNKNVKPCKICPEEVKQEIRQYMAYKKQQQEQVSLHHRDIDEEDFNDEDDDMGEVSVQRGKRPTSGSVRSVKSKVMKTATEGLIDLNLTTKSKPLEKMDGKRQTTINEHQRAKNELREKACQKIARWFYDAGISFNAVNHESFAAALHFVGQCGPNMKPPSYHEVRVKYLKKEVTNTDKMMSDHKEAWARYGCTVMCDGWKDKCGRHLLNFLVNCPKGTMFFESIDVSSFREDGMKMHELLSNFIERIRPINVVQVVTDNASAMKLAGKFLEAKYPNLYWTPCAAHCLELMLEDFGGIPRVKSALRKGIELSGYIYKSFMLLDTMKVFTGRRNLLRPGKTRFCTSFLTLYNLFKRRQSLRQMFTSERWKSSTWANEAMGKRVAATVLNIQFWRNVKFSLKVAAPIVRVLRIVDGEKKPSMGYVYEAMERAKEALCKAFEKQPKDYDDISKIVDNRWNDQLHKPLHAAGHCLNPMFYYSNKDKIEEDLALQEGLIDSITRLVPNITMQDKIIAELPIYKEAGGLFGRDVAKRHRSLKAPAEWWATYGAVAPHLQQFAIKVLSLTCSSSGCERNWSWFEQLHSKSRNRLAQDRLNKLIYVKYNRALNRRYDMRDTIDPISKKEVDESCEWLIGKMEGDDVSDDELVFEGGDLTWGAFCGATEARSIQTFNSGRESTSTWKTSLVSIGVGGMTDDDDVGYKSYDDEECDGDVDMVVSDNEDNV